MQVNALPLEQLYAKPAELAKLFSIGRTKTKSLINEMREDPAFSRYVISPAYRMVLVNVKGFEEYLISINYKYLKGA